MDEILPGQNMDETIEVTGLVLKLSKFGELGENGYLDPFVLGRKVLKLSGQPSPSWVRCFMDVIKDKSNFEYFDSAREILLQPARCEVFFLAKNCQVPDRIGDLQKLVSLANAKNTEPLAKIEIDTAMHNDNNYVEKIEEIVRGIEIILE
jgi:hypothetical protein